MKDYFEISSAKKLKLADVPSRLKPRYRSDHDYRARLEDAHARLAEFQTRLYANHSRALLIIFQGMDTAGKDGAIRHVMSGVNPQGCSVVSFKVPTAHELAHDFLWRASRALPARGQIGIFNRSYYEEVLVARVHPELLAAERLPSLERPSKRRLAARRVWEFRYRDIANYEKYLHRQGYEIVKIFIHISKGEQKRRLMDRFRDPQKLWKISEGDVHERSFWQEYQGAYEDCIGSTASKSCPWYIVPGDDKENARLSISRILVDRLENMRLEYPKLSPLEKQRLKKLKALLAKA